MSTVVRAPKGSPRLHKYCKNKTCFYNLSYVDSDYETQKAAYKINTVIRCDDCDQLWVVRPNPLVVILGFEWNKVRKLRWYHYAKYRVPKEVNA